MNKLIIVLALLPCAAMADTYVSPYIKDDGTFVQGHRRSDSDSNPYNNYSSQGNINPYTGTRGYQNNNDYGSNNGYTPSYGGYSGYSPNTYQIRNGM